MSLKLGTRNSNLGAILRRGRAPFPLAPSAPLPLCLVLLLTGCGAFQSGGIWSKHSPKDETTVVEMGGPPVDAAPLQTGDWTRAPFDPHDLEDPTISRWHHQGIDPLLKLRPAERPNLSAGLGLPEAPARAAAAIGLARWGDGRGYDVLVETVNTAELRTSLREAAAEALGYLTKPSPVVALQRSIDKFCRYEPSHPLSYSPELHDDLLRSLSRHIDAASDQRFLEGLRSPAIGPRQEALAAWGRSTVEELPTAVVDLRGDPNPQLRAAAIAMLLARKHPQSLEYAKNALQDYEMDVRIAAVGGLGAHGGPEARALLDKVMLHDGEMLRAEVVTAYERLGAYDAVQSAVTDKAWRVRRSVAAALAKHPDRPGAALARTLLADDSGEVRKATVAALEAWPLAAAGPVLLAALDEPTFETRRLAGEQLARRWPAAQIFSANLPADRRVVTIGELEQRWTAEFGQIDKAALAVAVTHTEAVASGSAAPIAVSSLTSERLDRLQQLVDESGRADSSGSTLTLDSFGPDVVEGLERLVCERGAVLPEAIYLKVLPGKDPVFAQLEQLTWPDVNDHRRAAGRLAELAAQSPLRPLATARLVELGIKEDDALVWSELFAAIAGNSSERVATLATAGLSHPSPEVRRLACVAIGRRGRPQDAAALLAALTDPHVSVVIEAVRALGHPGLLADPAPIERLTTSGDRNLRVAAVQTLLRSGLPNGPAAVERLAADVDPEMRRRAVVIMAESGDPTFIGTIVGMLDDALGVRKAAVEGLIRLVGYDVSVPPGETLPSLAERAAAWRVWYDREASAGRLPRR